MLADQQGAGFERSTRIRARLAARARYEPDRDRLELQRELKASRLAEHIARVVDSAPELTQDQRDRLALVLRPANRPTADTTPIAATEGRDGGSVQAS